MHAANQWARPTAIRRIVLANRYSLTVISTHNAVGCDSLSGREAFEGRKLRQRIMGGFWRLHRLRCEGWNPGAQGKVCGQAWLDRGDGRLCNGCNERGLLLVSEGRSPDCTSSVKPKGTHESRLGRKCAEVGEYEVEHVGAWGHTKKGQS